jgi:adenylate cyclase
MAIEKERKFLLKYLPSECVKGEKLLQGYLEKSSNSQLRVRLYETKACLTYKTEHGTNSRNEYEYEIPYKDGIELYNNALYRLEKTRYKTSFNNNLVDIDIYPNGIKVVEIEYETELLPSDIPEYCGEEVSNVKEYSNIYIAMNNGK